MLFPKEVSFGLILIIMYIISLCDLNIDAKIIVYVDDTCILFFLQTGVV